MHAKLKDVEMIFFLSERECSSAKYVPLLDSVDSDLAAKLDVLSSKGSDHRHLRNKAARPMKQMSIPPLGQGKRKQSAVGAALKRKVK